MRLLVASCALALSACHHGVPREVGTELAPASWTALPTESWHGTEPELPSTCVLPTTPRPELATVTCSDGRWLSAVLLTGIAAGENGIRRVVETKHGLTIYYDGNHPCGAASQAPHWRVLLPLPVRPIELRDETPGGSCVNVP